ncbi:MAG: peptide chain release factor N(5)-glutamine methyltransferase [Deltaproteobacteria bacterium]|jgi:release factor glutamine methyltransferase|nr:peptide chain release factor N(5)-glutamine methyltransferase [Deltaproteobacteria bacterium]
MTDKTWDVAAILKTTTDFFGQKGLPTPRLEAELLLAEILKLRRVDLYVQFERHLTPAEVDAYRELVKRRLNREPTAYILGRKEFYLLPFKVTPATLIPRPETERLVDEALLLTKNLPNPKIADIGCGCGAIALALAKNLPQSHVTAVDLSPATLEVAKENALALNLTSQTEFYLGDLTEPLTNQTFDLICANLPYVPHDDLATLEPDVVKFEPLLALDGGPDGLDLYRRLVNGISRWLKPLAYLLLEIHPPTLEELTKLIVAEGLTFIKAIPDYARANRLVLAQKPIFL